MLVGMLPRPPGQHDTGRDAVVPPCRVSLPRVFPQTPHSRSVRDRLSFDGRSVFMSEQIKDSPVIKYFLKNHRLRFMTNPNLDVVAGVIWPAQQVDRQMVGAVYGGFG